jgi:hypothetical protein
LDHTWTLRTCPRGAGAVTELTGIGELLRKQLADAEHDWSRLPGRT